MLPERIKKGHKMKILNLELDMVEGVVVGAEVVEVYEADSYTTYFQDDLYRALKEVNVELEDVLIVLLVAGYSIAEIVEVA
jgi:hypothetical protein